MAQGSSESGSTVLTSLLMLCALTLGCDRSRTTDAEVDPNYVPPGVSWVDVEGRKKEEQKHLEEKQKQVASLSNVDLNPDHLTLKSLNRILKEDGKRVSHHSNITVMAWLAKEGPLSLGPLPGALVEASFYDPKSYLTGSEEPYQLTVRGACALRGVRIGETEDRVCTILGGKSLYSSPVSGSIRLHGGKWEARYALSDHRVTEITLVNVRDYVWRESPGIPWRNGR